MARINNADFQKYGNLLFFDSPQIDYFYFSSLLKEGRTPEYTQKAKEVAAIGMSELQATPTFTETDTEEMPALQMLKDALNFLEQAVTYERNNEINYFKQKFTILKDSFSEAEKQYISEVADLENLFSNNNPESFDYDHMLVLINILMSGIKETKAYARYEEDRIKEIAIQMGRLKQSRRNQLNGLWKSRNQTDTIDYNDKDYQEFIQRANNRFHRNIEVSYVQHGNLSSPLDSSKRRHVWGARKYLADVPKTVDVQIAHWITDHINEVFTSPKMMQQFEQLAIPYILTGKANTETVREMLVKSIIDDGVKHTVEILQGTYKNLPTDEFIQTLTESLNSIREYKIEGYYPNIGQKGRSNLKYFGQEQTKQGLQIADELFDTYRELCKELQDKKKLTKEESMLMSAMKQSGHLQTYNRLISLVTRLEAKEAQFAKIQRQLREGRRSGKSEVFSTINLGASGQGDNIIVHVRVTADKIECVEIDEETGDVTGSVNIGSKMNQTSLIKKIGNGRTKATTIKGLIAGLKTKASHSLREDLSMAISKIMANPKNTQTQQQLKEGFEKALTNMKLSIGGPVFSELAPLIKEALQQGILRSHHTGHINRRNDAVTMTLTYNNITIESTLEDIMNTKAEELATNLQPELEKIQKQFISDFEEQFYSKLSKLKNTSSEFNDLAKNEKVWWEYVKEQRERMEKLEHMSTESAKLWEEYVEEAKAKGESEETINAKREAVLASLEDSFFVSQTMKTYNQYQNNLGFGGPSLGASVGQQLNNLNTLFLKAGIKMDQSDIDWLHKAIINCSPASIVGEKNKNIIENYLGSMAALAIFDEGAAEGQIIQDLQNKVMERASSSPNILHLYRVNGIYVPGSLVLQRTITELSKCLDMGTLAIKTMNRGAGVTILNTMNQGLIPNRGGKGISDRDPWGTVGAATDKHVKIKIMFLAGLLDIVNSMNKAMGDIELPS